MIVVPAGMRRNHWPRAGFVFVFWVVDEWHSVTIQVDRLVPGGYHPSLHLCKKQRCALADRHHKRRHRHLRGCIQERDCAIAATCTSLFSSFVHPQMRSEEHTSELQSLMRISYAVFCLKKKNYTYQ